MHTFGFKQAPTVTSRGSFLQMLQKHLLTAEHRENCPPNWKFVGTLSPCLPLTDHDADSGPHADATLP